nr:MAG: hypothetical protein [Bacteriophage sp.]
MKTQKTKDMEKALIVDFTSVQTKLLPKKIEEK